MLNFPLKKATEVAVNFMEVVENETHVFEHLGNRFIDDTLYR